MGLSQIKKKNTFPESTDIESKNNILTIWVTVGDSQTGFNQT